MPHKVNPIDFENSEAISALPTPRCHLSEKLPISRLQRDLSDSTVLRNMGVATGYAVLAYDSLPARPRQARSRSRAPACRSRRLLEVLAEPVQTVMRRYAVPNPYEQLKDLTRGKGITREALQHFIATLAIPEPEKKRLLAMTPSSYIGKAAELARRI